LLNFESLMLSVLAVVVPVLADLFLVLVAVVAVLLWRCGRWRWRSRPEQS
jgi:hypothetical protein